MTTLASIRRLSNRTTKPLNSVILAQAGIQWKSLTPLCLDSRLPGLCENLCALWQVLTDKELTV